MLNTYLYITWAAMYVICAACGILSVPLGLGIGLCVAFFVPPGILIGLAVKKRDRRALGLVQGISLGWLILTTVLVILNIFSVAMSELAGSILYYMLAVLCSPMVCGTYWTIAMFGWACLLVVCIQKRKQLKK